MAELPGKIRIKDIAELAGVSKGTVDRVLHNRGEVSESSRVKVEKVLEEMNFHPNVYAAALASKKKYFFHCILPGHSSSDYWAKVEEGINKQAEELLDLNVNVITHYYDQYDVDSCRDLYGTIPRMNPDGVLLSPLFKDSSSMLAEQLRLKNIPFVFVDSQVDGIEPMAYFGMHSFKSGHLAAKLLFNKEQNSTNVEPQYESVVIFHAQRKGETGANQTVQRRAGFMEYLREKYPLCIVHSVALHWNDTKENDRLMDEFFLRHPEVKKAVTFNSRVYMIADYFQRRKKNDMRLLGYDILEKNVAYLQSGVINYLLAQRPEIQGYRGLKALAQNLVFKQEIPAVNYMPMDILTAENIDFYINFPSI